MVLFHTVFTWHHKHNEECNTQTLRPRQAITISYIAKLVCNGLFNKPGTVWMKPLHTRTTTYLFTSRYIPPKGSHRIQLWTRTHKEVLKEIYQSVIQLHHNFQFNTLLYHSEPEHTKGSSKKCINQLFHFTITFSSTHFYITVNSLSISTEDSAYCDVIGKDAAVLP